MATKQIGILTAGGDCPGLNAAIRGIGKTAMGRYEMQVIGFYDGFRGLMENRFVRMDSSFLSGILTLGGTILGTSRDKPNKMVIGGKVMDMTEVIVENYYKHHLDCLVCLGGGGTQKNAFHLMQQGLNVITLPKTIDNDIEGTDITFGFDTALGIATEAIDRLHSTASSHHRIIVVEIMGHNTGWLTLGAGIAGGADVILIPEIPYDISVIAEAILQRNRAGKHFSIVAVAEGAVSLEEVKKLEILEGRKERADKEDDKEIKRKIKQEISELKQKASGNTLQLAMELEKLTMVESRVTILGHLQRGGIPSSADRLLATRLGTACASNIQFEKFGVMLGMNGDNICDVPLKDVVGKRRMVPFDHPWIESARNVGTCLGDKLV
ncbi:MAG: ATP-dependent 6-phosphofructokinase [Bacteroidales bacterium]|nr:ATP-dependent 6-phosphofructokinase [Bacteroidales bacterium]